MPKGGARPGAGRPKGRPNKSTLKRSGIAERELDNGVTPLEVMLAHMRDLWGRTLDNGKPDLTARADACAIAKDCAPYMHPRLAAIEQTIGGEMRHKVVSDQPMTDEEWCERYGAAAGDVVAPPAGPANGSGSLPN